MRDITRKSSSLRTATAMGVVTCSQATYQLLIDKQLPKGDWEQIVRAAGFLGAKQTQHLIPHCHPVNIDAFSIDYEYLNPDNVPSDETELQGKWGIIIKGFAKSIGKTGIEMEVLTGISIAALTLYDLLKPVDKSIGITSIKLLSKKGGKSDRVKLYEKEHSAAVLVCSDSSAAGSRQDISGKKIVEIIEGFNMKVLDYRIVADESEPIRSAVKEWVEKGVQFVFTTGGTGLSPRDVTIETLKPMLEKEAIGISEAMRVFGQSRTQVAMLSRQITGSIGQSLIVSMPGSPSAIVDCLDAVFPAILYAHTVLNQGLEKK